MVQVQMLHDLFVTQKRRNVGPGDHQVQLIITIRCLDLLHFALKSVHFGLHLGHLFGGYAFGYLGLFRIDKLIDRRGGQQSLRIGDRIIIHGHHQLRHFHLADGLQLFQGPEGVDRAMTVLQQIGDFEADAIEQAAFAADQSHVDIKRLGDSVFGHAGLDRFQDHLVFLNGGQAAYALVVGEGFVIGCDQAHGVERAEILQDLQADMAVEQQIGTPLSVLRVTA